MNNIGIYPMCGLQRAKQTLYHFDRSLTHNHRMSQAQDGRREGGLNKQGPQAAAPEETKVEDLFNRAFFFPLGIIV